MNHLDSSAHSQNPFFLRPVDLVVNTLAIFIVCGLLYKGTHSLIDGDTGSMFRSVETKCVEAHHLAA